MYIQFCQKATLVSYESRFFWWKTVTCFLCTKSGQLICNNDQNYTLFMLKQIKEKKTTVHTVLTMKDTVRFTKASLDEGGNFRPLSHDRRNLRPLQFHDLLELFSVFILPKINDRRHVGILTKIHCISYHACTVCTSMSTSPRQVSRVQILDK